MNFELSCLFQCPTPTAFIEMRVGVISDTHGLRRPEAIAALRGSDLIVHAGDIGRWDVLELLRDLAPTHAVRGNSIDLLHVLFGTVLALDDHALLLIGAIATVSTAVFAIIYRPLVLECFDPQFL